MYTSVNLHCPMSNFDPRHFIRGELSVTVGLAYYNVTFQSASREASMAMIVGVSVGETNEWGHVITRQDVEDMFRAKLRMAGVNETSAPSEDAFNYRECFALHTKAVWGGNRELALRKGLPEAMVIVTDYMDMRDGGLLR